MWTTVILFLFYSTRPSIFNVRTIGQHAQKKMTQQWMCGLESTGSQQSVERTNEVHSKEVSLRSAGQAVSMQWTHISSKTPPVASCVYILRMRSDLYSSKLAQAKLLSNHDYIHMKDTTCFQVINSPQSQTLFFSMTFANSPVQTKQWCGVTSRKQSPLFREGALGSTSRVWTWRRPGKTIGETDDFINWSPESAYLRYHTGDTWPWKCFHICFQQPCPTPSYKCIFLTFLLTEQKRNQ